MILTIVLVFIFILLSFYFSGSEAGFVAFNKQSYYVDLQKNDQKALRIRKLVDDPSRVLIVILLGNNLSNVAVMFLADRLWVDFFGEQYLFVFFVLSTLFFLIFCEAIPKIIYRNFANFLVYSTGWLIYFFEIIFFPVTWWLKKLVHFMIFNPFFFKKDKERIRKSLSKDDFQHIIVNGRDEGLFSTDQVTFLNNLSMLSKVRALELMIPLADLYMVHIDQKISSVNDLGLENVKRSTSIIPVYEKRIDDIIGYIDNIDVFSSTKKKKSVRDFLIKPIYVPEITPVDKIYSYFNKYQNKVLVMVNEYGGCSGIVTESLLVENIFGFRYNSAGQKKQLIEKQSSNTYVVDTSVDIDNLNEMLMLDIKKQGFETLGGFVNYLFEGFPEEGDVKYFKKCKLTILKATKKSVESVRIDLMYSPSSKK